MKNLYAIIFILFSFSKAFADPSELLLVRIETVQFASAKKLLSSKIEGKYSQGFMHQKYNVSTDVPIKVKVGDVLKMNTISTSELPKDENATVDFGVLIDGSNVVMLRETWAMIRGLELSPLLKFKFNPRKSCGTDSWQSNLAANDNLVVNYSCAITSL